MSALEIFTATPTLARPAIRALGVGTAPVVESGSGFEAQVRLAARLLPGAVIVVYRADHDPPLQLWPRGIMGRRAPMEPLALALCSAAAGSAELRVASLAGHQRFAQMREVQEAGPLAFAAVRLPGSGAGAVFGVLREAGVWTDEEGSLIRDLASAFAAEAGRQRLQGRVSDLQRAITDADERYAQLLSASAAAVITVDRSGRIAELSDAAATVVGRPARDLVGLRVRRLLGREAWEIVREALSSGTSPRDVVIPIGRATGETRTVQLDIDAALSGSSGNGYHCIIRDITEERAREAHLRLTERATAIAPLLSGVCHELNNPLTSIKSFAELLLLDTRSPDDREALEIVQREAHRAARIVGDLRMVARQSQEASQQRELVQLNEIVRRVAQGRARELELEGIELRHERAADLPVAHAVRAHLEQVVSQLISNAVNAMAGWDGPRVLTLATYRGDKGISLVVRDTGRGIEPEHLSRIFDPFWTSRRQRDGTGLGLSLVHSIVSNHGGRIVADSQLGRGSSITVELPVADDAPPEVVASEERLARQGLRVLVVDDEAPIRFSLARYMERRGHEVHQAADGNAALDMLNEAGAQPYDIIVADLRMPGLGGEKLLATFRQRGDGLEQRLIFMTGDQQSPAAARLLQESGIPVMWKPFELAEVVQVIEAQARLLAG